MSPSPSVAVTAAPTFAASAWSSATSRVSVALANDGMLVTLTVAVLADDDTAPNGSATLNVNVAAPKNPATGANTRWPCSSSDAATVLGRSPDAIAVPSSFSTPAVPAGSVSIRTAASGSPSASVTAKSAAAKVRSVSTPPVPRVKSLPAGAALVPRTFTASTAAGASPFVTVTDACARFATLPPDAASPFTLAAPDTRTRFPDPSATTRMPSSSPSAAATV